MHVPLIGCLNTHQLLPNGQGLWDCIWPFKNLFLNLPGNLFMQEDKDLSGASSMMPIKTFILWTFWHSRLPPVTIPSFKGSAQQWMSAEFGPWQSCDPVTSLDGYRLSGIVDTVDDSHICDTHPSWHMRETMEFSSWWGALWDFGKPQL